GAEHHPVTEHRAVPRPRPRNWTWTWERRVPPRRSGLASNPLAEMELGLPSKSTLGLRGPGNVEFHLDAADSPATPWPRWDSAFPSQNTLGLRGSGNTQGLGCGYSRCRLRRDSTQTKNTGTNSTPSRVALSMPPMTPVPMARCLAAPAPLAMARGSTPSMNASEVMMMGRKRRR